MLLDQDNERFVNDGLRLTRLGFRLFGLWVLGCALVTLVSVIIGAIVMIVAIT